MRRKEKVNDLLRDVMSEIVRSEIKDPRIGFISITDVEVAPDLSSARVFVSVMGDATQQKETLNVLHRARGFLRSALAQRMRSLRHIPELIFKLDTSIQTGARVFELLEQVKREEAVHVPAPPEEEGEAETERADPGITPAGKPV